MKIRAITAFVKLLPHDLQTPLARAGTFLEAAQTAFEQAGFDVQSRRLATQPFPRFNLRPDALPGVAARIRRLADAQGISYVSLGPADAPAYVHALPGIFREAPGIFASIDIASRERGVSLSLLRHAARAILAASLITDDGLSNLYLAASANVGPGAPFFPAAYHDGSEERFALALEAADLAYEAFDGAKTPDEARERLTAAINEAAERLVTVGTKLAADHSIEFGGLDFSLAPYPGETTSLAGAMERLGVAAGGGGMVAASALVMNAIEAASFPRCGFSGLMLPVLEDTTLGSRAAEGVLSVNDLLLYSAICGTGLDCIPLPGDVDEATLTGILLDVGTLALRLDKPLTARLMPLPGKKAGDPAEFSFEYFVPSRVMAPPHGLTSGALSSPGMLKVSPRRS